MIETSDGQADRRRAPYPIWRVPRMVGVMLVVFVGLNFVWPGDPPMDWGDALRMIVTFTLGFEVGFIVVERRYGAEALKDSSHPLNRRAETLAVCLFAVIALGGTILWQWIFG